MFIWVKWFNGLGLLSALLALAVVTRLAHRRLVPGRACVAGALMGFCCWVAFLLGTDGADGSQVGSLADIVWDNWVALAPLIVPLEAGLLGWLGTGSLWRWFFLGAGVVLTLLPWVVAAIIHLGQG